MAALNWLGVDVERSTELCCNIAWSRRGVRRVWTSEDGDAIV